MLLDRGMLPGMDLSGLSWRKKPSYPSAVDRCFARRAGHSASRIESMKGPAGSNLSPFRHADIALSRHYRTSRRRAPGFRRPGTNPSSSRLVLRTSLLVQLHPASPVG